MATLRQKKDGRYFIDHLDENRARKRTMVARDGQPCRDSAFAQAYFDHWVTRSKQRPRPESAKSPRISEILDFFQNQYLVAGNAAPASRAAAATHCAAFLQWCATERIGRTQQLNGAVLTRWLAFLQSGPEARGPRTANNYLTSIRSAMNVAVDAELIDKNPIRKWAISKVDALEKFPLSIAELRTVMDIFHDRPIVQWMCLTGQRPSDARSLKFGDVDTASCTVHRVSVKVRALRKFEIVQEAADLVARESLRPHGPSDIVFLSSLGKPWSADGLYNSIRDRMVQAEHPRPITPKMLRDSFGTIMANDIGTPLPELQILMGHTDINSTMQYVRARGARTWLMALSAELSRAKKKKQGTVEAPARKAPVKKGGK